MKQVGIILGHDIEAHEWKGPLMSELAHSLAAQGFVVGRYCCRTFEVKRRQMYEKALDALATSPVARGVNRWLLAGIGNGARVAAVVSQLCRGVKAGVALMSYPVNEAMPTHVGMKRSADESNEGGDNSEGPLVSLEVPTLFVSTKQDPHAGSLLMVRSRMRRAPDVRLEVLEAARCFVGSEPAQLPKLLV
eukprot:jgi/Astpho2/1205/fgenesh1_pg.00022_%23_14_t